MSDAFIQDPEDYVKIDLILVPWAKARGLLVSKEFTEKEDRFIQILDDAGDSYGLWIKDLQDDGSVSVVIAENAASGSRVPDSEVLTQIFFTKLAALAPALDSAYALAKSWMQKRGHMRAQNFYDGNARIG